MVARQVAAVTPRTWLVGSILPLKRGEATILPEYDLISLDRVTDGPDRARISTQ